MEEMAHEFAARARGYLLEDYLPKIERCLERLTDEQVWWRPNAESNSIGNLLLHLEGNARQWILSGVGGAPDARVRQSEFDERTPLARAALLERLRGTLGEIDLALAGLSAAALLESRRIQDYDVTVLGAIFHVVEHFAMHTGQILLMTKMLTGGDLAFYDFSGVGPRRKWGERAADGE